jgi:enoyl-CoA hydratase
VTAATNGGGAERQPVLTERRDQILVITLNRPEARNAVDRAVAEGIAAALDQLDADEGLRVGVLTGAGGVFSSGMDLKAFLRGETPVVAGRGFAGLTMRSARKPLIAAVEGYALAGGLEVALACDLIVAGRDARLGIPEARRGLIAAAGGLIRLPKRIPYHVAMEMALTGEPLAAERAAELGLVNRLSEPGGALDAAIALAGQVLRCAPLACEASKQVISAALDWSDAEAFQRQADIAGKLFTSADAAEGARAFAEKRDPVWRGA